MKYLNILFCVLMALFIAVQYNDPDGVMWGLIYLVPAFWAGLAAFRLDLAQSSRTLALLGVSVAGTLLLTAYYWPATPGYWHQEIWWKTETAREGMGMMIASVVLLVAAGTIWAAKGKTER